MSVSSYQLDMSILLYVQPTRAAMFEGAGLQLERSATRVTKSTKRQTCSLDNVYRNVRLGHLDVS